SKNELPTVPSNIIKNLKKVITRGNKCGGIPINESVVLPVPERPNMNILLGKRINSCSSSVTSKGSSSSLPSLSESKNFTTPQDN
ncbi:hypothetical protein LINPERHAP2_LOCUS13719, partial [Linum perenne]